MHNRSFSHFTYVLAAVGFLFAITTGPLAQTKPVEPNPRQILDRGVAAMGGKEKLKAITSRQVFASVKRLHDGATGRYELLTQYPSQFYYRLAIGNEFEQAGFNGITGYGLTSATPLTLFNEKDANLIYAEAIYRNGYWFHDEHQRMSGGTKALLAVVSAGITLFANFDSVKFEGEEQVNGRVLQGVRFNLRDFDTDVRAYFDQANGRLAREELTFGKLAETYFYDDYRAVNGILEPHTIRLKRGTDEYEIKVERILYNQPLALAQFELPAGSYSGLPAITDLIAQARAHQQKILTNYDQFTYERLFKFTDSYCIENSSGPEDCTYFDRQQQFDVMFYRTYPMLIITADDHNDINSRFLRKPLDPVEAREKRIREARSKIDLLFKNKPQSAPNEGLKKLDGAWGRDVMAVLQYAQFSNIRPATREGRACYAIDFLPAPERDYGDDNFVKQAAGTIYVDAQTQFVVYMLVHGTQKMQNRHVPIVLYTSATRTQAPICDGLWLPTSAERPLRSTFWRGERFDTITYCNYQLNGQPLTCTSSQIWPK